MVSQGQRVCPCGRNSTARVMLDHFGGLVHLLRLGIEKKLIVLPNLRSKHTDSIKHYPFLSSADKSSRTWKWPRLFFPAPFSPMNHFSPTIEAVTLQIPHLLLVWAATRTSAWKLCALVLILRLAEVACELNRELFTWEWQHQLGSSILWLDNDLTPRPKLSLIGRPVGPLNTRFKAEKRLSEEMQNMTVRLWFHGPHIIQWSYGGLKHRSQYLLVINGD